MPLLICSQMSDVYCLLPTPEPHECAFTASAGAAGCGVRRERLRTNSALSVASIAMPMKAAAFIGMAMLATLSALLVLNLSRLTPHPAAPAEAVNAHS